MRKSVRVIYRYRSDLLDRVPLSGDDDGDTDGPHGDDVVVEFEVLVYTSEEWNMEKCMNLSLNPPHPTPQYLSNYLLF